MQRLCSAVNITKMPMQCIEVSEDVKIKKKKKKNSRKKFDILTDFLNTLIVGTCNIQSFFSCEHYKNMSM